MLNCGLLGESDRNYFKRVSADMDDSDASMALYQLSDYLYRYYGQKVIILLDEYDTPMQEAYVDGYWEEMTGLTRSMFNAAFKTNPWLERALMTGITRVSKESIFSDMNNLKVVSTTSDEYAESFGFTEKEVFSAMEEYGFDEEKEKVKLWYDGFTFGNHRDIYRYVITSNSESGFGRYDVMMEPRNPKKDDAILLEFKVHDPDDGETLQDTVREALAQIKEKQYAARLLDRGIPEERIRSYGFAFQGKHVLIG